MELWRDRPGCTVCECKWKPCPNPSHTRKIFRLRSGLRRFRGFTPRWPVARPGRDRSGTQSKQPRTCVRRPRNGLMDDMPTDEQGLKSWLEDKNLEMRDALDVGGGDLFVGVIDCEGCQAVGSMVDRKFQTKNSDLDQLLERIDSRHVEIGENTQVCRQVWDRGRVGEAVHWGPCHRLRRQVDARMPSSGLSTQATVVDEMPFVERGGMRATLSSSPQVG